MPGPTLELELTRVRIDSISPLSILSCCARQWRSWFENVLDRTCKRFAFVDATPLRVDVLAGAPLDRQLRGV